MCEYLNVGWGDKIKKDMFLNFADRKYVKNITKSTEFFSMKYCIINPKGKFQYLNSKIMIENENSSTINFGEIPVSKIAIKLFFLS